MSRAFSIYREEGLPDMVNDNKCNMECACELVWCMQPLSLLCCRRRWMTVESLRSEKKERLLEVMNNCRQQTKYANSGMASFAHQMVPRQGKMTPGLVAALMAHSPSRALCSHAPPNRTAFEAPCRELQSMNPPPTVSPPFQIQPRLPRCQCPERTTRC